MFPIVKIILKLVGKTPLKNAHFAGSGLEGSK
jgi:hypothetical protein